MAVTVLTVLIQDTVLMVLDTQDTVLMVLDTQDTVPTVDTVLMVDMDIQDTCQEPLLLKNNKKNNKKKIENLDPRYRV